MKKNVEQGETASTDAISLLKADHRQVKHLFARFVAAKDDGDDAAKTRIVAQICEALTLHTALEEEIFYPAVRDAIDDADQMDEALVEHAGAKALIAQLQTAHAEDYLYDAKVAVLSEQIEHHVMEEEGSLFPKAAHAGLDLGALGQRMLRRRTELLAVPASLRGREVEGIPAQEVAESEPKPRRAPASTKTAAGAKPAKKAANKVAKKK